MEAKNALARRNRLGQRPDRGQARRRRRQGAAAGPGGPRRRGRRWSSWSGAGQAGHRHAGGRARRGQGEHRGRQGERGGRRPRSSSRRARSPWPSRRSPALCHWCARIPRSGPSIRGKARDGEAALKAAQAHLDRPSRSRSPSECSDVKAESTITPAESPVRARPLPARRGRRGPRAWRQGPDPGEPGGRLHGDLPAVRAGRPGLKSVPKARTVDYVPDRAIPATSASCPRKRSSRPSRSRPGASARS